MGIPTVCLNKLLLILKQNFLLRHDTNNLICFSEISFPTNLIDVQYIDVEEKPIRVEASDLKQTQ